MSVVKVSNLSSEPVPVTITSGGLLGTVAVSNFPATQPVSGSVSVSNLPSTQSVSGSVSVSGTVSVSNFPVTQPISGSVSVSNFPSPIQIENFMGHNTLTVAGSLSTFANGSLSSSFSPVISGSGVFTSAIMSGPSANGVYRVKGRLCIAGFSIETGTTVVYLYFGENNSVSYYPGSIVTSGTTVTSGTNADRSYTPVVISCYDAEDVIDDYDFLYSHTSGNPIYFYYCALSTVAVTAYCTNTVSFSLLP